MNTQQTDRARPVAITGLGAITPYGDNADVFFKAIVAGAHAFVPIKLFANHEHRTRVGAEIRELAVPELKRTDKDVLSRCDLLALTAALEALKHSRLLDEKGRVLFPNRIGVIVGSAAGGILGVENFFRNRASGQPTTHNPQPATRNPQPATRNPQPATRNPQPATRNPQPATRNPQPATRNPHPATRNPQPATRNPQPATRNPQPATRNPQPCPR